MAKRSQSQYRLEMTSIALEKWRLTSLAIIQNRRSNNRTTLLSKQQNHPIIQSTASNWRSMLNLTPHNSYSTNQINQKGNLILEKQHPRNFINFSKYLTKLNQRNYPLDDHGTTKLS
jgi:hypothetical protein